MTAGVFFQDLAILMTIAGIVSVVFSRLGWPKVIGYIFAGVLMSEHTWGGGFLIDAESTNTFGQLGVVFLMFAMGLSFSRKDMEKIRTVSVPSAILDTVVMIWIGYNLGTKVFGWSPIASAFLGVAICDSATTMLVKMFEEIGWSRRAFTKYVLGTSVFEDVICVGAIAVVTGFANGGGMSASRLFFSLGGLAVFFLTVVVFGFVLMPRLLKSVSRRRDDEALVLAVLGVCFLVSYFAYKFQFSLAIGAFLVGLVCATCNVRSRLYVLLDPLKSMFAAMFFVSIGLLVDPTEILHCLPKILIVSAVVIIGKSLNNFIGAIITGLDVKSAVQHGFSLAQIGEFAFMVATLYMGLSHDGDTSMFQVAVGVSLLTTLLNPLMVRASDPAGEFLSRKMPKKVTLWLQNYQLWIEKIRSSADTPAYLLLKASMIKLGIYAVLMLSVSVACSMMYKFDFSRFSSYFERNDEIVFFFIANLFSLSLLPMVIASSRALGDEIAELLAGDGSDRWRTSIRQFIRFVVLVAVVALFFIEWTMIDITILPVDVRVQGVSAVIMLGAGVFGWRFFVKAGRRATTRFQEALTAEERREGLARMVSISVPEGTVHRFLLNASSLAIGESVVSLDVRAKTGATIVSVHRGTEIIRNVGPELEFKIGDVLVALGEPSQIVALKELLGVI